MKKQKIVWPQYVKDSKGKILSVYIPIEAWEKIQKDLKDWERIQKEEGVKWVNCTTAMSDEEILSIKK